MSRRPGKGEQGAKAADEHDDENDDGGDEHGKIPLGIEMGTADDGVRIETILLECVCRRVGHFPHLANFEDKL